jgi:hypothetical protein
MGAKLIFQTVEVALTPIKLTPPRGSLKKNTSKRWKLVLFWWTPTLFSLPLLFQMIGKVTLNTN